MDLSKKFNYWKKSFIPKKPASGCGASCSGDDPPGCSGCSGCDGGGPCVESKFTNTFKKSSDSCSGCASCGSCGGSCDGNGGY